MNNIIKATKAEWIKIKGLGLIYTAAGLTAISPLLEFVIKFFSRNIPFPTGISISVFEDSLTDNSGNFAKFFIILFIILASNRICQIDHKNGGWLLMETQPVSKLNIYLAKYLNIVFLTLISICFFFLFTYAFSALWQLTFSKTEAVWGFDVGLAIQIFVKMFVASLGISAFMMFVSMVIPGYIWPFMLGILGLVLNLLSVIRKEFYPYSPLHSEQLAFDQPIRSLNTFLGYGEAISVFWAIVSLCIGYLWYSKKSFKRAFIFNTKTIGRTLAILLVFAGLYYFIQKPKQLKANGEKTIISGTIQAKELPESIDLMDAEFKSVIAKIPVKDGKFSWESKDDLPLGMYMLRANNNKFNSFMVLGKGDYYHFDVFYNDLDNEVFTKTNRKAELQLANMPFANETNYLSQLYRDSPEEYYKEASKSFERSIAKIEGFKTAENYMASDDFLQYKVQNTAVAYLSAINDFHSKSSKGEDKYKELETKLKDYLKEPTSLTLSDPSYANYVLKSFVPNDSQNADSVVISKIKALEKGQLKDKLLSTHVNNLIENEPNLVKRKLVVNQHLDSFTDQRYKKALLDVLETQKSALRGVPFPEVVFTNAEGKAVTIGDFKGKYIIMELWSDENTKIRPLFERRASENRWYKNLAFVSVNMGRDKQKWSSYIKENPSADYVKNVWLENAGAFLENAQINTLPRFIILDTSGNIYDFDSPGPDDIRFEETISSIASY